MHEVLGKVDAEPSDGSLVHRQREIRERRVGQRIERSSVVFDADFQQLVSQPDSASTAYCQAKIS